MRCLQRWRWLRCGGRLVAALVLVAGLLAGSAGSAAGAYCVSSATSAVCTFSYTGNEEPFSIPAGVSSLHIVAVGATSGYGGYYNGGHHARGAVVIGDFPVAVSDPLQPGERLYVEVGGNGITGGHFGGGGRGGLTVVPAVVMATTRWAGVGAAVVAAARLTSGRVRGTPPTATRWHRV